MKIIVRDDDCNYFTSFNYIEAAYKDLWSRGAPICLSVVPSILSDPNLSYYGRPSNKRITQAQYEMCKNYPINKNKVLCDEINKCVSAGLIEIALHGFSHDVDEFHTTYAETYCLIKNGIEILSDAFPSAKISTFVAPYDILSKEAVYAILDLGLSICTSKKKLEKQGCSQYFNTMHDHKYNSVFQNSEQFILTSDSFFYYESLGANKSLDNFLNITLDSIQSNNQILVCTNHYWQFFENSSYVLENWRRYTSLILHHPRIQVTNYADFFSSLQSM